MYENIFLRKELLTKLGTLDKRAMLEQTRQLMSDLGKVGDTVVKEWLEKAGTDGQAVLKAFNDSK